MNEYLEIKSSMSLFESINKIINETFLIYINPQKKERKKKPRYNALDLESLG